MANQLLGDKAKDGVLELNASDDRGIDTVRDKIKSFASKKLTLPEGRHKIIILDEADSMTEAAQQALRLVISNYSNTTRFALACNDSTKIIEPIQSRCVILRFSRLETKEITERLIKVMNIEGVEYDQEGLNVLALSAEGDMRHGLNNLQSTVVGFGKVTKENVYRVVDIPKPEEIQDVVSGCETFDLDKVLWRLDNLIQEGYTALDIVGSLTREIELKEIDEIKKIRALKELTISKMKALDGIVGKDHLYGLVARIIKVFQ